MDDDDAAKYNVQFDVVAVLLYSVAAGNNDNSNR